jgi:hypothetical protein
MSIIVMKSDATNVTNLDQVTDTPLTHKQGVGPETTEYPNSGPVISGPTMPWQGGFKDTGLRSNNATPGRSADLPMGNGPVPGVTRK